LKVYHLKETLESGYYIEAYECDVDDTRIIIEKSTFNKDVVSTGAAWVLKIFMGYIASKSIDFLIEKILLAVDIYNETVDDKMYPPMLIKDVYDKNENFNLLPFQYRNKKLLKEVIQRHKNKEMLFQDIDYQILKDERFEND